MTVEELKSLMPIVVPVLGGVGTVLGLLVWLIKWIIENRNEQIKQLKDEKQTLEAKVRAEEANAKRCQLERDDAVRRKDEAERKQREAEHVVTPLKIENAALKPRVQELEKRNADYKAYIEKQRVALEKWPLELQKEQRKRADAEAERDIEKKAHAKAKALVVTAELRTESAETKASILQDERDTLDAIATRLERQIEGVTKQDGRVWNVPVGSDVPPFVPLGKRQAPVISVLNLKGGVGKTTITANLAGYLSSVMEKRVLLILL